MLCEELGSDAAFGGLLSDRLRAVFAELGKLASTVPLGSGAPRAVETVALIQF